MDNNLTVKVMDIKKTFLLSRKQMKIDKTNVNKKIAVAGLSFETYENEIFGLLGPNGAGKTTTLRCIAGLIKPDNGRIFINDIDNQESEIEAKKYIGFLTNELKLEDQMTPNYAFNYYGEFYDINHDVLEERKTALFARFGIDKFQEVKIGDLSTGMKQKVSIAVSLAHDPKIVIFDEPTNGLDVLTAKSVTDYLVELKNMGKTIIISTHIMSFAESICDRVGIIIDGKMTACDTLENIQAMSNTHKLEDVFFDLYKNVKGELE